MNKNILKKIDWVTLPFFVITPILTVYFIYLYLKIDGFDPYILIPTFLFWLFTGMSITAGYHRLFSHRSYKTGPLVEFFFLMFGAGAFQYSVLKWCTDHRRHHLKVDHDEDPYNINKGFFWAHIGWLFIKEDEKYKDKFAVDLEKDPLIAWQHKYIIPISIFMAFILPAIIGYFMGSVLGGIAFIGLLRMLFVHHMTFFINSLCHIVGFQTYTDTNTAKDSPIMALFTYGEGYHNFHHFFQTDYRNAIRWYQYDPTKWLIKSLELFGMAWDLKLTPQEDILKAKLLMEGKRLDKKLALTNSMELKTKIDNLLSELSVILDSIKKAKKELKIFAENKKKKNELAIFEIKRKLAEAKINFKFKLKEYSYVKKSLQFALA
ncbi:MAG: acyl-CoA desaturase [Epsilonproteobacteria bacterium]|nr:MAG: acyl-CoA desaturase [Campylobacterota bacterium]RLA64781.1 MAG: acyl-CoA desaturase [Campylobacterota bacterium]